MKRNDVLYRRTARLGLRPVHVAEVGVYLPETSNVLRWIEEGVRTELVEADPEIVRVLEERFGELAHVTIHPYAVHAEHGTIGLYRTNASTFVEDLPASPALVNDRYQPKPADLFHVETRRFDELDDGTLDVLSVDTEGCEWFVLRHMTSRPAVISLETHGKRYENPWLREIQAWIAAHDYRAWYRDASDTVYVRADVWAARPTGWNALVARCTGR